MNYDAWKTTPPDDDPEGEHQDEDREPPEADGEAFRGDEAAAYERERQADIQRTLK